MKVTIYVRPLISRSADHYSAWLSPRRDRFVNDFEWTKFIDVHCKGIAIEGTLCPERTLRSEWAGELCSHHSFRLEGINDANMKTNSKGRYRESSRRRFLKAVKAIAPRGVIIKWL